MGGFRTFAAARTKGSYAQIATFSKSGSLGVVEGENGPLPTLALCAAYGRYEPKLHYAAT